MTDNAETSTSNKLCAAVDTKPDKLKFLDDPCYTASGASRSPKVALRQGRTTLTARKLLPWKPGEEANKNRRNRGERTAQRLFFAAKTSDKSCDLAAGGV